MIFKDQINTVFELNNTPKRIVSLVPSLTELLVDLGLEDAIVGVTKFCVHPNYLLKNKTIVGGTKTIKADKIKQLQPDFILCNKEENTEEIVNICREITTTYVSDIYTIADTLQLINKLGVIFDCEEKAKELILGIISKQNDFLEFVKDKKIIKAAYFIWKKPWMVAANDTFIQHLLELNKCENAFSKKERYPIIELSELSEIENLDVIFLSSEPFPFDEKHVLELQKVFTSTKIILVDGEFFSWYGSRLLYAFDYFKTLHQKIEI